MAEKGCKQCGACKGFASRTPTGKFCSSCGHPKSNHFGLDDEPAASPPAAAAAPAPVPVNAINAEASAKADAEKAEADRLAAGKAAAEKEAAEKAEADRLAAESAAKAAADREAAEKAEADRLAAESAAKAAADREAAEKAEADRLAAEKEAAEKAEADRLAAENAAKAAAEKEAAEKAEADRLVAESAAKAAADRAETLKEAADNDDLKKAAAENTEADRLSVTMPDIIEAEKAEAEKTSPAPTTGESAASNESAEKDSKNDNSSEKNADVASSTSTEEPKSMSKRGSLFANAKNDAPPEPTGEAHPPAKDPIDPSAKQTPAVAPSGTTPKYMGKSTSSAEVASSAAASSGGGPVVGMSLKERMALLSKSGSSMGSGPVGGPPPGTSPKRLSAPSFLGVRTDSIADGKTDDARLASEESEPPRKSVKELMKGAKLPSFGPPPGSPGGPPVFGFGMPRPPGSFAKAPEEDRKLTHNNLDRPTMVEKRNSTGRKRAGSSNAGRRASFDEDGVDGLVEPISAKEEEKKMASTL